MSSLLLLLYLLLNWWRAHDDLFTVGLEAQSSECVTVDLHRVSLPGFDVGLVGLVGLVGVRNNLELPVLTQCEFKPWLNTYKYFFGLGCVELQLFPLRTRWSWLGLFLSWFKLALSDLKASCKTRPSLDEFTFIWYKDYRCLSWSSSLLVGSSWRTCLPVNLHCSPAECLPVRMCCSHTLIKTPAAAAAQKHVDWSVSQDWFSQTHWVVSRQITDGQKLTSCLFGFVIQSTACLLPGFTFLMKK